MKQVILFLLTFIFVFLFYQIFIIRKAKIKKEKKSKKKLFKKNKNNKGKEDILPKKPMEIKLLESKYKLDLDKINYNRLLLVVSLVSSLDISILVTLVLIIDNYLLQILLALVLAFPLILLSYSFIGKYYVKKGLIKNE